MSDSDSDLHLNRWVSLIYWPTVHIMFITSQPIQLTLSALREHSAHRTTDAKIVPSELGQMMPQTDAVLTDNTKDWTHCARSVLQGSIWHGLSAGRASKIDVELAEKERLEKIDRNHVTRTVYFRLPPTTGSCVSLSHDRIDMKSIYLSRFSSSSFPHSFLLLFPFVNFFL